MLKSFLLFFRKLITTKTQLILENIFLRKQLDIYQRTDPKLNIKLVNRIRKLEQTDLSQRMYLNQFLN